MSWASRRMPALLWAWAWPAVRSRSFYRCNCRTHCFAYRGLAGLGGVQHMCLEANDLDDVRRAYDLVEAHGLPITLTLGRHSMDRLVSFYMRGPSGFNLELGAGGELLGPHFVL